MPVPSFITINKRPKKKDKNKNEEYIETSDENTRLRAENDSYYISKSV